jgi:predicted nucleotidyltransferase
MIKRKEIKNKEIEKIANKIAEHKSVKAVYLFGSYASGKVHANSDIDLCVISDDDDYIAGCGLSNFDVTMFRLLPIAVRFRVFKEGVPLIVKDKDLINKLKIQTLREYIDFRMLMKKFYMEKLKCMI